MPFKPPDLLFIEDVVASLVDAYDVHWHVDGDDLEPLSLAARDGFLPLWVAIGRSNAIAAGLIESEVDFPIRLADEADSYFSLRAEIIEGDDPPRIPFSAALLFIQDAISEAMRLDPEYMAHEEDSRVNLAPVLNHMEATDVPEIRPEHSGQPTI